MMTETEIRKFINALVNEVYNGQEAQDAAIERTVAMWLQDRKDEVARALEGAKQQEIAVRSAGYDEGWSDGYDSGHDYGISVGY